MRILLKNAKLMTLNKKEEILDKADILIEKNKIVKIGRSMEDKADQVIHCTGKIVMPGLVNSHLHSDENMFRGLFDNLPLEPWMLYSCPPLCYGPFSPRLIYLRTMLGAIEMIKNGVTCVQDDVSECPKATVEGYDQVFQAYKDIGLKGNIALNMGDRAYMDRLPYTRQFIPPIYHKDLYDHSDPEEMIAVYEEMIHKWDHRDGMRVVFSTSAPQRCTDQYLKRAVEIAETYDMPMHTHTLETRVQRATGSEFYGKSIVEHIKDLGFLTNRLTIIHGVWMDDQDIEMIGEAGASIAHNPVSNLKLGSGIMPLNKMLQKNVNVVLGTDGMSSNDSYNLFETMKYAALLQKVTDSDYTKWTDVKQILKMAIQTPVHSLRRGEESGSLEEGKEADIIILNMRSTTFTPFNDLYKHLVYCEDGRDIETVIVSGKIVMENKKILNVDEEAIIRELQGISVEFKEKYKRTVAENEKLLPYIDQIYKKCMEQYQDYTCNLDI